MILTNQTVVAASDDVGDLDLDTAGTKIEVVCKDHCKECKHWIIHDYGIERTWRLVIARPQQDEGTVRE